MRRREPDPKTLEGAVTQVRGLIDHLRKTTASAEVLAEVEQQVASLNRKLEGFDHEGPWAQRRLILREGVDHERDTDDPAEFFRYSPVIGPANPIAPPVEFRFDGEEISASHVFGAPYNGPPTAVHGGVIALVFDELLGCLGAMRDIGGFTGTLNVVYRSLTPLGRPIRMRGWVERQAGVKVFIKGTMHVDDGPDGTERLCAEAEGIFIRPRVSVLEDAIARARP